MDEIDGMSGGDRGGVGALKKIIQTTRVFQYLEYSDFRSQSYASAMTDDIQN